MRPNARDTQAEPAIARATGFPAALPLDSIVVAAIVALAAALLPGCGFASAGAASPEPKRGVIALPNPDRDGAFPVERALAQRRSVRAFSGAALPLQELGQLLWAAQGISGSDGKRTAPSAGALYPLEVIVVAGKVSGLEPGLYRYLPARHALEPWASGDLRPELSRAARGQSWMREAPATLAFTAVEDRSSGRYGKRAGAYVLIEVGHASQNVFLQAEAIGLGAAVVGAFDEARTAETLRLPAGERPLYLMPVGRRGYP